MKYSCKSISPKKRLSNLDFDPRLQSQGSINIGTYKCPVCGNEIQFKTTDFQRHLGIKISNLDNEINIIVSGYRPLDVRKWESFLDFSCSECNLHVRIIYEPFEFAMGSYKFTVTDIIECRKKHNHFLQLIARAGRH